MHRVMHHKKNFPTNLFQKTFLDNSTIIKNNILNILFLFKIFIQ